MILQKIGWIGYHLLDVMSLKKASRTQAISNEIAWVLFLYYNRLMNNWYVITGAPSCGKTALIEALEERGVYVEHESARMYIDEQLSQGKTIEEIRADEEVFQREVFNHKIETIMRCDKEKLTFFDRGMQDSYAYAELHNFNMDYADNSLDSKPVYKKVFLLELPEYKEDYARTESKEEAEKLFDLLKDAYEGTDNMVVIVPVFDTKEERVAYFLDYLEKEEKLGIL